MNLTEKTLDKRYIYNGRIINLRVDNALLPNGKSASREVVEHPGGVCVVALTENDEVLLVKQYRYPYGEVITEIPAGKREHDEDPLECGKRELLEETGATAEHFFPLGELYPTPGYCGEVIYMYGAKDLTFTEMNPDEDEFLEAEKIPLETLIQRILSGEIKDAKTQAACLKLDAMIKRGLIL